MTVNSTLQRHPTAAPSSWTNNCGSGNHLNAEWWSPEVVRPMKAILKHPRRLMWPLGHKDNNYREALQICFTESTVHFLHKWMGYLVTSICIDYPGQLIMDLPTNSQWRPLLVSLVGTIYNFSSRNRAWRSANVPKETTGRWKERLGTVLWFATIYTYPVLLHHWLYTNQMNSTAKQSSFP